MKRSAQCQIVTASWSFYLKSRSLHGLLVVLLVISWNAGAARAQETISAYRGPIFLAVDGISNVINECWFDGSRPRSHPYLAPALSEKWGIAVQTVGWSGTLHDAASYERFLADLQVKLKELLVLENQLVIIAHSWGSIAAYLALKKIDREIAQGSFVPARKRNLFVTLGSPIEKASLFQRAERCWPGSHVAGRDLIRATNLESPGSITFWLNFSIDLDPIANPKITHAINRTVFGISGRLAAHGDYYNSSAPSILHYIVSFLEPENSAIGSRAMRPGNKCPNLVSSPAGVPGGYGAPFNFFDRRMALSLEAICAGGALGTFHSTMNIVTGHNYAEQYTYERGYRWDGRSWRPFQFMGAKRAGPWIVGRADAAVDPKEFARQRPNWFLAYTCHKDEQDRWRCGCQDRQCQVGRWQAQVFIGP